MKEKSINKKELSKCISNKNGILPQIYENDKYHSDVSRREKECIIRSLRIYGKMLNFICDNVENSKCLLDYRKDIILNTISIDNDIFRIIGATKTIKEAKPFINELNYNVSEVGNDNELTMIYDCDYEIKVLVSQYASDNTQYNTINIVPICALSKLPTKMLEMYYLRKILNLLSNDDIGILFIEELIMDKLRKDIQREYKLKYPYHYCNLADHYLYSNFISGHWQYNKCYTTLELMDIALRNRNSGWNNDINTLMSDCINIVKYIISSTTDKIWPVLLLNTPFDNIQDIINISFDYKYNNVPKSVKLIRGTLIIRFTYQNPVSYIVLRVPLDILFIDDIKKYMLKLIINNILGSLDMAFYNFKNKYEILHEYGNVMFNSEFTVIEEKYTSACAINIEAISALDSMLLKDKDNITINDEFIKKYSKVSDSRSNSINNIIFNEIKSNILNMKSSDD